MKKSLIGSSFMLAAAIPLLVNCQKNVPANDDFVAFDSLRIDTVRSLFTGMDMPACHLSILMPYPSASMADTFKLKAVEDFIVKSYFDDEYLKMHPKDAAMKYCGNYIDAYMMESISVRENYGADLAAAATWMSYDQQLTGKVYYNDNYFLSYGVVSYSYTGGAHGMTSVRNNVFDLKTSCSLELGDLFEEDAKDEVTDLLRASLVAQKGCSKLENLRNGEYGSFFSPEEIDLTDNFYIDSIGITWQFDPYEIAPYATGIVSISLSWNDIIPYLLPDSPIMGFAEKVTGEIVEKTE